MEAIPTEWVDKLFTCMAQFYGERWTLPLKQPRVEDFYKTVWKGGLTGLTYDEIKTQLLRCKKDAEHPAARPPTVMDFFHYAKNTVVQFPTVFAVEDNLAKKETALHYMAEIKQKLGMRA